MLWKISSPWFQMHRTSLAPDFYCAFRCIWSCRCLPSMTCPFAPFVLKPSLRHHILECCILPCLRRASLSLVLKPLVSSLYTLSLNIRIDSDGMIISWWYQYVAFTKLQKHVFNCPLQWQFSCLTSSQSICIKLNFTPSPYMGFSP